MAKLVILKSVLDAYYDNMIEKSTTHKYIRRVPKSNGKGYNYFYPEDFKKPVKALLSFFGMKEDTVDKAYTNNNISQAYGVTKQGFAQHVLEYLTNRKTWNTFFANKANRDRYKIPEKPVKETEKVTVSEKEIVGGKTKEKVTVEEKETKEKNFKSTWNRSLMRKIYSMYNKVPEDKTEEKPGIDSIMVGDSVSYNGKVGKVTKDFENGLVFVNFDNGGMGRFFVKDLQKMNVTADDVTESADENAAEQNVNGTNEAIQEEVTETVKEPVEKPGFNKTEKAVITLLYEKYKEQLKDKYPDSDILNIKIGSKIIEDYPELDAHGDVRRTMMNVRGLVFDKKLLPDVVKFINDKNVKGENPLAETVKENPYNSVGADIVKDYTEKLDKIRNSDRLTEKQKTEIIANEHIPELVDIAVKVSNKTSDTKEQAAEKAKLIVDAIKNNMPENEQALFLDDYNFDRLVDLRWDKKKPSLEELKASMADSFVADKRDYLNAKPIASNNARILFSKIWDNLKDKSRNEQIRGLYNAVKDDYVMSWTDSLKHRAEGLSDEEIRFGYINDFLNFHSAADNVIKQRFKVEHEDHSLDDLKKLKIDIEDNIKMAAEDEYSMPEDVERLNTQLEAVNEMIAEKDTSALSQAMMGNQNARKYGNLSDEANEVIARQNLNVNEEGVVQPSEEEVKASAEFWNRNKAKNYRFQKDQYGNTYMIMDGLDGYFWDKDGKRVDGAEMVHERTYHDEYIPQEPHITIRHNGGMNEYIYLTPDMKADLELGNTDYQPVDSTYVKPEKDTIREDYIGLQDEKTQDKLKNRTYQMNKLYDMAKKTGIQVMEYTGGMMSNHGKITHVVLPIGVKDQNSEQGMFIDKTDKVLVDYAKYLSENVEPTEKVEVKDELEKWQKNFLTAAFMAMKKEERKLEKARVDAGLPKPQMFERTSTIDDSTWDPNSKNYRFRDTGYIAGARKEQAALYITRSAKEGVRVNAKEVDWNGIEENPRTAEKLIVKSNIFGDVDWNSLREKGMSGSAAFLIDRIYASAGAKPDENNADARHNYVIALNGLRDRFEDCKTVEDVLNTLSEIKDEINGEYMEIKESPKYNELRDKMKAQRDIAYAKKDELDRLSENGRKTYDTEYQKVVEKYIEKGKKEKKLHWNARVSQYNIPKEYEESFKNDTKDLYKKAYAPWEKAVADFKAELKARGVKNEEFFEENRYNPLAQKHEVSWYDLWRLMPEMKEYRRLGKELEDYVEGAKVVVAKKNPLLEAWKTLGSKFMNITRSDTFAQHRYDCKKGKYDDWAWAEKEVTVKVKKQSKEKKVFNFLVAEEIERKGGRNIDVTSTADLKKAFNLRDVQSGNWVLKDPESADFHVRNAARAFADLADITGIPDDKISLNGRLAMAFGARGTGNAGGSTAMAHYEHEERVINLTKFKGGGCLGHEWFHAFDNLITCAMNGDNASDIFLTNRYSNLTPATKALVLEYLKYKDASDYMGTYRRGQIARKLKAKNFDVAELNKPQSGLQLKVQNAFDELVKAMTTGTTEIKSAVVYSDKDYKDMLYNFKEEKLKQWRDYDKMYSRSKPTMQVAIADAGNLNDAVKMINARYGDISDPKTLRQKGEWIRLAAAYYDRNPSGNKLGNRLIVDSGKTGSQFLADAFDLDENGEHKDYWSTTHEMAARAFSSYIEDTLAEQGRKNDYLAYAADNKFYDGDKPYPEGEERKRINAAFKKLFEVIRENNAIEKAVAIVDAPDFIIKNGRFLIRK